MATHCSILAWRIPWTEEPVGLQSMRLQRVDTTEQLTLSKKEIVHTKVVYTAAAAAIYTRVIHNTQKLEEKKILLKFDGNCDKCTDQLVKNLHLYYVQSFNP